jgi:outer membrane protein OmpA-like peptidoglycan-associated protein
MRFKVLFIAGLSLATTTLAQSATSPKTNLLEIPNGTVIVSASSMYNNTWSVSNLIDGSTKTGWCSADKAAFPHTIVFELAQPHAVTGVAVDNTGDQGSSYPGISAKDVVVYGSNKSATEGFTLLTNVQAPAGSRKEAAPKAPITVQWLKFAVNSNWGNADYTEIMELEAFGQPDGPPPKVDVTGIYQTNYGGLRIDQDGTKVSGCYDLGNSELSGNLNGRVMQVEWREQTGKRSGTAIMVLSLKGETLNGFWYENGQLKGEWTGKKGGNPPKCKTAKSGGLAEKLAETGKVEIYGIYFDSNSAVPKPESEKTLNEILAVLQAQSALKLTIAGHTDSTNTDAYNLKLSQQRAEAIVAWLVKQGVANMRLTAKGFGKSQPVADNATAAGRALNRRVELIKQ